MGSNTLEPIEDHVIEIPNDFMLETLEFGLDPEIEGIPESVLVGQRLEIQQDKTKLPAEFVLEESVTEIPEGFVLQVDDPFANAL